MDGLFTEIIIAPDFTPQAETLLQKKNSNRRLIRAKFDQNTSRSKTSPQPVREVCWFRMPTPQDWIPADWKRRDPSQAHHPGTPGYGLFPGESFVT